MTFDTSKLKKDLGVASWPFKEARSILELLQQQQHTPPHITLQTGYGPSGLPHLGTFGEVLRTTLIKIALEELTHIPVKIIAFSDDLDGLRKVPENVPEQKMLQEHLHTALSSVPDPYGTHKSFADHNNAQLRSFLDQYEFEYEFHSSTADYQAGVFNDLLKQIMAKYEIIRNIVLGTVGEERQQNYSPFLPVCPATRQVLQAKVVDYSKTEHTITYEHPVTKEINTISILDGNCKLQWKVDWAMRWAALNVHYEMFGKDLVDSVKVARKVSASLGYTSPLAMVYELFLDKDNLKISKSKGNGLTFQEWLKYGNLASLALYLYQSPTKAKKLDVSVIPRVVDQYIDYLNQYNQDRQEKQARTKLLENPVWFIHNTTPPQENIPLSYSTLINIAQVSQAQHVDFLWQYIQKYNSQLTPAKNPIMHELAQKAIDYCRDNLNDLEPQEPLVLNTQERQAIEQLCAFLTSLSDNLTREDLTFLESKIYEIGKSHNFTPLSAWFALIYKILIGQSRGPRLSPLILTLGTHKVTQMLQAALKL